MDLVDITGKYSSTNVFASDGMVYENTEVPSFTFTFIDQNDITDIIVNQVEPVLSSRGMQEFYYENFLRPSLTTLNLEWSQSTTANNETTGFFKFVASGAPAPVGPQASDNKKYIAKGGLIKFVPPAGFVFNNLNRLKVGSATLPGDKTELWATVTALELDGTNQGTGNNVDGTGPVTLNNFIPTNAVPTQVIVNFVTDLPTAIETTMRDNIELYRNFGLGYDNLNQVWYVITASNLDSSVSFSLNKCTEHKWNKFR